jgi:hypothetical protein
VPTGLVAVGLWAGSALVGVGVFAVQDRGADRGGGSGTAAAGEAFAHVHGLAVDPGTRAVLAATHHGLYRVDGPRSAVRVSRGTPDLMGFTVVGPGHYLASGHPGEHDGGPGNLGLVESTDGGSTWQTLSLAGAADFHGLRAAHGHVYGHNSATGAFLVSTDRKSWQKRSTAAMGAFVVSPTDPAVIVAVGRGGPQRSVDGGVRWQSVAGSPPLTVVDWEAGQEIVGADTSGAVWQSPDAGQTWQRRGALPAAAQALTSAGGTLYAAVTGEQVLTSADGGATWSEVYRPASHRPPRVAGCGRGAGRWR